MAKSILEFVPPGWTLEPHQKKLLLQYEKVPDFVKVVAILAPVASGKSLLNYIIASFEADRRGKPSTIINRDNALNYQYLGDFPAIHPAPYRGTNSDRSWEQKRFDYDDAPVRIANFFSHLSLRMYPETMLIDEAHQTIGVLQDMEGLKLWKHLTGCPDDVVDILGLTRWLMSEQHEEGAHPMVKKALKLISRDADNMSYEWGADTYRGTEQEFIRLFPLTPKNNKPVMWPPSKVKRIVLTSATLAPDDIIDMGLGKAAVKWLYCDSPIPIQNRPAVYEPSGNMSYFTWKRDIGKMAEAIAQLAEAHQGRGLLHTTYQLSGSLLARLREDGRTAHRIMSHTKWDKAAKFKKWQASENGILLGSGMAEGIDLKYDKAEWQAITKIVWPNKTDRAVAAKMESREDWYAWETMKLLMQQYGRVCRRPDDYGVTYILDEQFENLWKKAGHLATAWFREALQ